MAINFQVTLRDRATSKRIFKNFLPLKYSQLSQKFYLWADLECVDLREAITFSAGKQITRGVDAIRHTNE